MLATLVTILSPFLGIVASLLPSIVRLFEQKESNKHEIELTKLKMDAAALQNEANIDVETLKAIVAEGQSLRDHDTKLDGGRIINAVRASVRPVVTYLFFATFVFIKLVILFTLIKQGASTQELIDAVWNTETMALFAAIMGFWFGGRLADKREAMLTNRTTNLNKTK